MKYHTRIRISVVCLCLLLFCGCGVTSEKDTLTDTSQGSATTSKKPEAETGMGTRIASDLDEEIQTAIDAHETKRFWRVEEAGNFPETVSVWSFDPREDTTLWSELREGLLADVTDYSEKYYEVNKSTLCRFELDGREVEARIIPLENEISFSFLTTNRAKAFGEKLADYLSNALGLPILDWGEEHTQGRTLAYTPVLGGLPLDQHICLGEGFTGYFGVWVQGKTVHMNCPMQNIHASERLATERFLKPEEVQETLLFANLLDDNVYSYKSVSVYQSCQPVYMADTVSGTIRPAWRVSGKQYIYAELAGVGEYSTKPLEILVDALTGEVFYAEGVSNGL